MTVPPMQLWNVAHDPHRNLGKPLYLSKLRPSGPRKPADALDSDYALSVLQVLMCDHGLFHIEADLRWIELISARLTQLKKELQSAWARSTPLHPSSAPAVSATRSDRPRRCAVSTSTFTPVRYSRSWARRGRVSPPCCTAWPASLPDGTFVAVVIAGISLAVSTAAAMLDRKRVLGLMRLMGMPVEVVRGVIAREAAVPLVAVLLLSAGLGFVVAWLMVISFGGGRTITWPGPVYYAALSFSILLALAAVTAAFGLIRSSTAIPATRFE